MVHKMKLRKIYYEMIKSGAKIYEGRLNDEKRRLISVGDIITFQKEPEFIESFNCIVKDLVYFDSFEEMVKTLPLEKIGFKTETAQEVVEIYHKFYSVEDENRYGVVAIKVEVIQ